MMKVSKLYLLILLLFLTFSQISRSQDVCEGGFYLGTNMSKLHEELFSYDNAWGGQAGVEWKVGSKWCQFEGQIGYSAMMSKFKDYIEVGQQEGGIVQRNKSVYKAVGHYLDLPLYLSLGWWDMEDSEFGFTVMGGAYMEVGLAGTINIETDLENLNYGVVTARHTSHYSTSLFGDDQCNIKRFNAGWTVGARLALGYMIRIGATYRHGLIDLSNVHGRKSTRNSFFINIAFAFGNY